MKIPYPIVIYNETLLCSLKNDKGEIIQEFCNSLKDIKIDFGKISTNESRKKYLNITNYDPYNIIIKNLYN